MSWNYDRNPGNWQGNTGYTNMQGNWYPNTPGYNQGNWGWNTMNPNYVSGNWGQGFNQGNWGGTWPSNRQGWTGNQNWGPWNAPGITGNWMPWSSNTGNYPQPMQGYGPTHYTPWNTGYNNWNMGYGTSYGYGPQTGYNPNFNPGYGYGQGWGTYGQGFGNYPFEEGEGEYSGVGPRSYRRPDQRIEEDVCDELTADSFVDAHDVNVSVNNGVVTLSGTVPSRDMRRRAEEDADSVNGVSDVRNDLRVSEATRHEMGTMATEPTTATPPPTRARGTTR